MAIKAILIAYSGSGATNSVRVYNDGKWLSADRGMKPEHLELEEARKLSVDYKRDHLPTDFKLQVICIT